MDHRLYDRSQRVAIALDRTAIDGVRSRADLDAAATMK
jgi:hypothetical protein